MTRPASDNWSPTRLLRLAEEPLDTSMGTAKVKTDATFGYLKALGNRQGPHALACDWIGTSLAKWFDLPVAECAILTLDDVDCYPLPRGARVSPGPAFVSRHVPGRTWGKTAFELESLENRQAITRLIVFDTWVRNCDRHPPDLQTRKPNYANVYLGETADPAAHRLYAIDHTHCFNCGRDLTPRLADIDAIKDDRVYGLFPEFQPFVDVFELAWCKTKLYDFKPAVAHEIVTQLPAKWEVSVAAMDALVEFVHRRAIYLADKIDNGWGSDWRGPPPE